METTMDNENVADERKWFYVTGKDSEGKEDPDYIRFAAWFTHVNKGGRFDGLLTKQQMMELCPLFELYATDQRVLGEHAGLWSHIRMLEMYPYAYTKISLFGVWVLYVRVLCHKICGDEHTSRRLEYAYNMDRIRRRPLMIFLSTLKERCRYLRTRLYRRKQYQRISKIYAKQGSIFWTGDK
jgi:hypothetical protein